MVVRGVGEVKDPSDADLAEAVRQASDLSRHAAALLAGVHGMTRRAAIRRLRVCAHEIAGALGGATPAEDR